MEGSGSLVDRVPWAFDPEMLLRRSEDTLIHERMIKQIKMINHVYVTMRKIYLHKYVYYL